MSSLTNQHSCGFAAARKRVDKKIDRTDRRTQSTERPPLLAWHFRPHRHWNFFFSAYTRKVCSVFMTPHTAVKNCAIFTTVGIFCPTASLYIVALSRMDNFAPQIVLSAVSSSLDAWQEAKVFCRSIFRQMRGTDFSATVLRAGERFDL